MKQQDREKILMKWSQNLELDVFICVELDFVVNIDVSLLLEADALIFYPLNRVTTQVTGWLRLLGILSS